MASAYFTLPSLSRGSKSKEPQESETTTSKSPVLDDADEQVLQQQISDDKAAPTDLTAASTTTIIADDGGKQEVPPEQIAHSEDQVVLPEQPAGSSSQTITTRSKARKSEDIELPSQEEAEAATRGFNASSAPSIDNSDITSEKKPWSSYLPSLARGSKSSTSNSEDSTERTWTEFATTYLPNFPESWRITKPSAEKSEAAEEKDREALTNLLATLQLSTINNRVFAFKPDTEALFAKFSLILQDMMRGVPTAYDDLEKLMREAGPKLEAQFKALPPFVRTLVKSLPAKLGPEALSLGAGAAAAVGEKPDAGLKINAEEDEGSKGKKGKRKIPGLKSLVSRKGAVAGMLRNVVTFLQTRFPFLASTTNVVMSLAVFILMFVFWYCHKRGREVRLAEEAEAGEVGAEVQSNEDDDDESSDGDNEEESKSPDTNIKTDQASVEPEQDLPAEKPKVVDKDAPFDIPSPD